MSSTGVRGSAPCAPRPDDRWALFSGNPAGGRSALRGPIFAPPKGAGRAGGRAPCPDCGVQTPVRVCPDCHTDLPTDYCDQDSRIIALIGPKAAGKSTYVTVLAHELRHRVGQAIDASLSAMGTTTQNRYRQLEDSLYDRLLLPGPTQPAAMRFNDPLLFRLSLPRRGLAGMRGGSRHTALVFFDAAGEDLASAEAMDRFTAYLAAADGVIVLVDPLQLRPVRDRLTGSSASLPSIETAPEQIVADLAAQLRRHGRGQEKGKVTTPVAVALTKSDVLESMLDPSSPLLRSAPYPDGALDEADRTAVHQEVRALLEEWDGGLLHRRLERDFAHFSLFGLSALGAAPTADAPADAPKAGLQPRRVEDPLLWLLGLRGLIPVRSAKKAESGQRTQSARKGR
ncbi:hypothetical protein ACFO3J_35790 [Streptomyces polygonati]|uniref:Double-GTPase 2 domain-containing protein n=1 Tax=Streptomyces polygonati TaxID=1617087 RepID=A0ABV8I0P4_9ACTN